ncbi:hypothetical protein V8E36_002102 [Tilletia maclaganii]
MPADRSKAIVSTSRRPGWDSVKGKWWCGCSVRGCARPSGQLTEVSKRTYLYHKKEQKAADRHAKENVVRRQSAQQDRQGPSRMPLREFPSQSEQASASSSGFDAGAYTLGPSEVDAFDTGIGMSQPSGLIDEHDCDSASSDLLADSGCLQARPGFRLDRQGQPLFLSRSGLPTFDPL